MFQPTPFFYCLLNLIDVCRKAHISSAICSFEFEVAVPSGVDRGVNMQYANALFIECVKVVEIRDKVSVRQFTLLAKERETKLGLSFSTFAANFFNHDASHANCPW